MQYFHKHYTSFYENCYMKHSFDRSYYQNKYVTWWSLQWGFARKINSGLVVVPLRNMVINLGLGQDATNTKGEDRFRFLKFEKMNFPLIHPEFVIHDRVTDDEIFRNYFTTTFTRIKDHVKHLASTIGLEQVYLSVKRLKDWLIKVFSETKRSWGSLAEVRRISDGK